MVAGSTFSFTGIWNPSCIIFLILIKQQQEKPTFKCQSSSYVFDFSNSLILFSHEKPTSLISAHLQSVSSQTRSEKLMLRRCLVRKECSICLDINCLSSSSVTFIYHKGRGSMQQQAVRYNMSYADSQAETWETTTHHCRNIDGSNQIHFRVSNWLLRFKYIRLWIQSRYFGAIIQKLNMHSRPVFSEKQEFVL